MALPRINDFVAFCDLDEECALPDSPASLRTVAQLCPAAGVLVEVPVPKHRLGAGEPDSLCAGGAGGVARNN